MWRTIQSLLERKRPEPPAAPPDIPAPQPRTEHPGASLGRAPSYDGWCKVCGQKVTFTDMSRPVRETFQCAHCRASMRERVTAAAILAVHGQGRAASLADLVGLPRFAGLAIYEPGVAGAYRGFLKDLPGYQNSFYWDGGVPGQEMNGVRHEDLMHLSFADQSFDLVITSDIFEHIRHPWVAFEEVRRVLKPGGTHIFSLPALRPMQEDTVYRVDTSGPDDVHILEPYYHGDGRGGKSLVYTDYGADFLDRLQQHGFRTFEISDDHVDAERRRVVAFVSLKL